MENMQRSFSPPSCLLLRSGGGATGTLRTQTRLAAADRLLPGKSNHSPRPLGAAAALEGLMCFEDFSGEKGKQREEQPGRVQGWSTAWICQVLAQGLSAPPGLLCGYTPDSVSFPYYCWVLQRQHWVCVKGSRGTPQRSASPSDPRKTHDSSPSLPVCLF